MELTGIASPMLSDAMPVSSMVILSTKHRNIFIQYPPHGHLKCEEWTLLDPSVLQHSKNITSSWPWWDYFSKCAEVVPLKEVKTLNVIKFIKHHILYHFGVPRWIVYDNEPNLLAKHFIGSVINSESKVCHQRHTIQLLMTLQKLLRRLLESFSRNLSRNSTRLRWLIRWIPIGLSHNGENSDKGYAILLGVWMWSFTLTGDLDPISASYLDNQDGRREEASTASPRIWSFRRQTSTSQITNRALSSPNF